MEKGRRRARESAKQTAEHGVGQGAKSQDRKITTGAETESEPQTMAGPRHLSCY